MANVCCMAVCFYVETAKREKLEKLQEQVKKVKTDNDGRFSSLLEEINPNTNFTCFAKGGSIEDVHDIEEKGIYSLFYMDTACDWNPKYDFLNVITSLTGVKYATSSEECDADIFEIVGDPEGLFFTHNYSTDIYDDRFFMKDCERHEEGIEFFDTEEEILAFLHTLDTDFESDDLEEWDEYLNDEDVGHVRIWQRIDTVI